MSALGYTNITIKKTKLKRKNHMGATATGLTIDHDETQSKAQIRTKIKNQFHAVMKQDQK